MNEITKYNDEHTAESICHQRKPDPVNHGLDARVSPTRGIKINDFTSASDDRVPRNASGDTYNQNDTDNIPSRSSEDIIIVVLVETFPAGNFRWLPGKRWIIKSDIEQPDLKSIVAD